MINAFKYDPLIKLSHALVTVSPCASLCVGLIPLGVYFLLRIKTDLNSKDEERKTEAILDSEYIHSLSCFESTLSYLSFFCLFV